MRSEPAPACPICATTARRPVLVCRDHLVSGERFDVVECERCGLRMTAPQPAPAEIGRYYESDDYLPMTRAARGPLAAVYRLVRRLTVRMRLALVARYAGRAPGRLLDVGCGTGEFLAHAHGAGWSVVGVEPGARAAAQAEGLGLEVRRVHALDAVTDGPFDAITMWHALEHMHDPGSQLERAAALLAAGGCLVVAVPNHRCADADAYGAAWYAWDVPRHLWHFHTETLGALLATRGLVVAAVHAMPFDPFYIALQSELRGRGGWNVARAAAVATRSALAARRDPSRACGIAVVARRAGGNA